MLSRALALTLLAGTVALAGCGGITSSGGGTADASVDRTLASSDTGPGVDTAAGDEGADTSCLDCDAGDVRVPYSACPSDPPTLGDPCSADGETCEYGPTWWLVCNTVLRCTHGTWQKDPISGPAPCDELDAGGPCPATWAEANATDAGPGLCPAADCQYPEGYCECLSHCGGGGMIHASIPGSWRCQAATPTCPSPRPLLGTSCDEPDSGFCNYSWPCGCGQSLECRGSVWEGYPSPPCP